MPGDAPQRGTNNKGSESGANAARVVQSERAGVAGFVWVGLSKLLWLDERGRSRTWECAERLTRRGAVDGVAVVATLAGGEQVRPRIVLVSQFRPPTRDYALELPAGLVDAGESPGEAALRELREETGFLGELVRLSPIVFSDPGLSNANMQYAFVEVDARRAENQRPQPTQEDSECIATHLVFLDELLELLSEPDALAGKLGRTGRCVVDARLYSLAIGLALPRL
jgi:ADP-ribose pyrophosphatase